ncbi:MAG: alpha/beta fold hydrolase [Butyricimonas faecihominis]
MKLFFRTIGEGTPLIILHGLWGASENWLPIAHLLEDKFQVILPDVRNHGQSPHDEAMNYEVMSNDVIELIKLNSPSVPISWATRWEEKS